MKVVIEKLNPDILQSNFGFQYDGYYWVKYPTPVKLLSTDDGDFNVLLDGANLDEIKPEPISYNSELIKVILALLPMYVQAMTLQASESNTPVTTDMVLNWAKQYLQFPDERIQLDLEVTPTGLGLSPRNEYTYTLLSGIACRFKVLYKDETGEVGEELIEYNPNTMSYQLLQSLFPNLTITGLFIKDDPDWIPFYGTGSQLK